MKRIILSVARFLGGLLGSRQRQLNRSTLVGMYLSNANADSTARGRNHVSRQERV